MRDIELFLKYYFKFPWNPRRGLTNMLCLQKIFKSFLSVPNQNALSILVEEIKFGHTHSCIFPIEKPSFIEHP